MFARTSIAALALLASVGAGTPAEAQRYRERVIEVFGNDRCPEPRGDEIVVCKRLGESERFRIPTELREPAAADAVSQESRVDEMVAAGRTGTGSCSAVGPGGFTGCFQRQVENSRAERRDVKRARQEEPQ